MQKQQLISIKDAATSTGISEETIRKYIRSGKITGEKKNYIFWDEWFVSQTDLEKIRESVELEKPLQSISAVTGSLSSARNSASLVGAGITAATDNGIKSNVNYSWMPDASHSHSHKFGSSTKFDNSSISNSNHGGNSGSNRANGPSLPASLAAEIERAFAPHNANEAFGARAYLEHSDEQTVNDEHVESEAEDNSLVRESNVSKFSVGRPTGRRKRADQKNLGQKVFEHKRADAREDQDHADNKTNDRTTNDHETNNQRTNDQRTNDQHTTSPGQSLQVQSPHQAPWNDYRSIAKTVAEEFLAPLLSRLESQAALLAERDKLISEQAAQLRLLPDLQKVSEEQRKLAEQKQQEALQLKQNLQWERKKCLIKISAWQMKHIKVERQLKAVEQKVSVIQEQADSEVNYLHCQLTQLKAEMLKANKPWWKKIFGS
jgi:hypothetical protein